jgi:L-ascorbate metabolism protein UlaG (beta-lactamase superfamily)
MPGGRFPVSDHCDGDRFFNPHARDDRTIGDLVKWWRTRTAAGWPESLPLIVRTSPPPPPPPDQVAATFIGHSTFLLQTPSLNAVTDPVWTNQAGPFGAFGPRRVRPPALPLDAMPRVELVLISHNHYDHLQKQSVRDIAARWEPLFVVPLGLAPLLARWGVRRTVEMDWWDEREVLPGVDVTCVPAQHFSARGPHDRNRTLWAGYALRQGSATIYFAGDTGYSPQFAEIGRRVPGIDLALVPIGAYEPRWFMRPVHVNPEEAVRIHRDVGAQTSIAMHFGTFCLTDEGIDEPVAALRRACAAAALPDDAFRVPEFGESIRIG